MNAHYAYSLNGEHYTGRFTSREQAAAEAIEAAQRAPDSPQTIFVGRIVPGDPKASGHARMILNNMAARAREEFDDAASNYLAGLSKSQIDQLDDALELVVLGWLQSNQLLPSFFKVEAIGEYQVPNVAAEPQPAESAREVQEIGVGAEEA